MDNMIPKKLQKNFCVIPWAEMYNTTLGTYGMCCVEDQRFNNKKYTLKEDFFLHWNSDYMKKTRVEMLAGKKPMQCSVCWRTEQAGLQSMRHRKNERYKNLLSFLDIEKATSKDGHTTILPLAIKLSVGRVCQLRCISCSPAISTGVKKDYDNFKWDHGFKDRKYSNSFDIILNQKEFDESLYPLLEKLAPHIRWLDITGGEPTLNKKVINYLNYLIKKDFAKNIITITHSNGVSLAEEYSTAMKNFSYAMLIISIDGTGDLEEYLRYPANWQKQIEIIQKYKKFYNKVEMLSTIWFMNVNHLEKLIDFSYQQGIQFDCNILEEPDELHIRHMPTALKETLVIKLKDLIKKYNQKNITEKLLPIIFDLKRERDQSQWQKSLKIMKTYDRTRRKTLGTIDNFFQNLDNINKSNNATTK